MNKILLLLLAPFIFARSISPETVKELSNIYLKKRVFLSSKTV